MGQCIVALVEVCENDLNAQKKNPKIYLEHFVS